MATAQALLVNLMRAIAHVHTQVQEQVRAYVLERVLVSPGLEQAAHIVQVLDFQGVAPAMATEIANSLL